jgi:Uma2 family endonuclease
MTVAEPIPVPVRGAKPCPLSIEAYRTLGEMGLIPEESELLYGFVYPKMAKSPFHSGLVRRLLKLLRAIPLPGRFISSEQPITCVDSEPEPDIAIIKGSEDNFWHDHPQTAELVIEICVSSHEYDRSKLRAYARAGVKEVWLVLGPEKQIEVHREPINEQYTETQLHGPGGSLQSISVPELTVNLDSLFP